MSNGRARVTLIYEMDLIWRKGAKGSEREANERKGGERERNGIRLAKWNTAGEMEAFWNTLEVGGAKWNMIRRRINRIQAVGH